MEHAKYEEARKGIVTPNYITSWWKFWEGPEATPQEHNSKEGGTLNSPYTSWTTDKDVAINYALRPQKSGKYADDKKMGVVLRKTILRSQLYKTPIDKKIVLIHKPNVSRPESEYLLYGEHVTPVVEMFQMNDKGQVRSWYPPLKLE